MSGPGSNQEAIRRNNLSTVLGHVHRAGQLSRSALTNCTGLNRSTVGALVNELAARGLVEEVKAEARGTPGRPSTLVRANPDGALVLAAEVAVDSMSMAVSGIGGQLHQRARIERSPDRLAPKTTVIDLLELACEAIAGLEDPREVVAMGVAVAGLVRRRDGFVHVAPNLGWRDLPLGERLSRGLGSRFPVFIGNEADLGALAEHSRGAGAGVDDLLYVSGEVGVGTGIIVGGKQLHGSEGYSGEAGHMVVNPSGVACTCGSQGCWETEVGARALLRHAGRADTGGSKAVDAVLREASAGIPSALRALETLGAWLGIGLAGLINIFNPNRVVLGGLFSRTYPYLAKTLRAELDRRVLFPSRATVDIVSSTLGMDSSLHGAAELALQAVLADPSRMPVRRPMTPETEIDLTSPDGETAAKLGADDDAAHHEGSHEDDLVQR